MEALDEIDADAGGRRCTALVEGTRGRLQQALHAQQRHVGYARQTLRQLDPKVVLRRGYTLVRDEQNALVCDALSLKPGAHIAIETSNAIINAGVTHVQPKE